MAVRFSGSFFEEAGDLAAIGWSKRASQHLLQTYPDYFPALDVSEKELQQLCQGVNTWAHSVGIQGERDVYRLCLVATSLGATFWTDPRFDQFLEDSVGKSSLPVTRRAQALTDLTKAWLETLWQDDRLDQFGARMANAIADRRAPDADTLQFLVPGHWSIFSTQDTAHFLELVPNPFERADQQTANAALALVHGKDWRRDPTLHLIERTVSSAPDADADADALARALRDIYKQFA